MQRLLVSAAHKSSGKTTVTLGLAAALSSQGTVVQPFKKGPDYIDPMWLALDALARHMREQGRPALAVYFGKQAVLAVEQLRNDVALLR